jgi:hypothetical protein
MMIAWRAWTHAEKPAPLLHDAIVGAAAKHHSLLFIA